MLLAKMKIEIDILQNKKNHIWPWSPHYACCWPRAIRCWASEDISRVHRDYFVYAHSQWETMLQCNIIFHWLGTFSKWSLSPTKVKDRQAQQGLSLNQQCLICTWWMIWLHTYLCTCFHRLQILLKMPWGAIINTIRFFKIITQHIPSHMKDYLCQIYTRIYTKSIIIFDKYIQVESVKTTSI